MGESICYNVLGAREVDKVAGKLRDEGQLPLLQCQPGQRNPVQSLCEKFVVGDKYKISTFQEETEFGEEL